MNITEDIKYIGVSDYQIKIFEGQYPVPEGMTYNSYLILDEKTAVLDSVDKNFGDEWLDNIEKELKNKKPDYLIVHHMEPDHSANIKVFMDKYPETKIVASAGAFNMMKNVFGTDFPERKIMVKENDKLVLGKHTLAFVGAPFVHWPEVLFSYDDKDKVLFSADGFGKFGSRMDTYDWACEARRYYFGIVGKFGINVQNVLKKASGLEIKTICPLHGPVLNENLSYYLGLYDTWSRYEAEKKGVAICYSSVYGSTKEAAEYLAYKLKEKGIKAELFMLNTCDMSEALEAAFMYDKLVLATTTYNGGVFPCMKDFISHLLDHNYQKRTIAFIENGMWAPLAYKGMKTLLEPLTDICYIDNKVTLKGCVNEENKKALDCLSEELSR